MKNKCKKCGNKFNEDTMKYVIETRHTEKPRIIIENLPIEKCTVCDNYIIPESSQQYIDILRQEVRREMAEMVDKEAIVVEEKSDKELEENPIPTLNLSKIKDFIHRLIS